jgi:hypothetical protein
MLAYFIAVLRPGNPMAKLSKRSRRPEAPAPAVEPAPRVAPRRKTADQRLRILERLTIGLSVVHIARVEKLTVRRVRQIIAGMLESREIDPPAGFVQLQVARLSEAMIVTRTLMIGRSSGGRQNDQAHARTRSLSRLRAGPNFRAAGAGPAPATRRVGAAATVDEFDPGGGGGCEILRLAKH